jgi:hypothetical protein
VLLLLSIGTSWFNTGAVHAQSAASPSSGPEAPRAATAVTDKASEKAARDAFERGRVFYDRSEHARGRDAAGLVSRRQGQ